MKNSMKWTFTFYFIFLSGFVLAQQPDYGLKENSIWWFGTGSIGGPGTGSAGLNFNIGTPAPISILSDAGGDGKASATVCDTGGNFLFYTEGTFVLDVNGNFMPHGDSLVGDTALYPMEVPTPDQGGNSFSATSEAAQGAVVIPMLNNPNQYYIFSLTEAYTWPGYGEYYGYVGSKGIAGELYYSVVDMTLNNGLGDVISSQRGLFLDSNLTEGMVAVAGTHCDMWILVHGIDIPLIYAFNVNINGVNPVPVISHCGNFSGLYTYDNDAGMKVSPNRRSLAVCSNAGAELCDFDPATGIASNARVLSNPPLSSSPAVYQACFSPDNSKLYLSYRYALYLFQYDLTDTMLQTNTSLGTEGGYFDDPQLGPDGKIYIQSLSGNNSVSLDCIASPNLAGTACNRIPAAVMLPPSSSKVRGLHSLYVKPPRDTTYSSTDITLSVGGINLAAGSGYLNYLWNDGTVTTDSDRVVIDTGTYWVTYGSYYCNSYIDTFIVRPPTGVAQVKEQGAGHLTAYPNPAQNIVTVTIDGINEVNGMLQITDVAGRVVLIQTCANKEQTINVGDMAAGVHTVVFIDKALSVRLEQKLVVSK